MASLDQIYKALEEADKSGNVEDAKELAQLYSDCLLYTSPSPRDATLSRMPSSA